MSGHHDQYLQEDEEIYDDDNDSQWSDIDSQNGDLIFTHDPNAITSEIILDENDYQGGISDDDDENIDVDENENEPIQNDSVAAFTGHQDFVCRVTVFDPKRDDGYVIIGTGSGDDSAFLFHFNTKTNAIQDDTVLHLVGHSDTIADIQFNFNGELVATAGYDNRVGIWETKTGKLVHFLDGPGDMVEWITWHPKGNLIACGSADTTSWLWNAKSAQFLNVFAGHSATVTAGIWTTDGQLLVTGSDDSSVRVWNPKTAECVHTFSGDLFCQGGITCIVPHPNHANVIACGSIDGSAVLLNIETKRILAKMSGHESSVEMVSFNPSSEANMQRYAAATCGLDGKVCVWDSKNFKVEHKLNHDKGVVRVLFDNNTDATPFLYTCSEDRSVRAWDLRSGEQVKKLTGHRNSILDMALIPSSGHLITGSDDNTVLIFNVK
jgi:WD40 repeat protein